jgi:hypothetical protein
MEQSLTMMKNIYGWSRPIDIAELTNAAQGYNFAQVFQ